MDLHNLSIGPESFDYLDPLLNSQAVKIHFEGHHLQYQKKLIDFLNNNPNFLKNINNFSHGLLDNNYHPLSKKPTQKFLEKIIIYGLETNNTFLYNNAAQIWNHNFLWMSFKKNSMDNLENFLQTQCPTVYNQIIKDFINLNNFLEELINSHEKLFGNIWVWLVWNTMDNKLEIKISANGGSLCHYQYMKPLLAIDLWEHAYYNQYQNRKLEYINTMITYLNWPLMESMLMDLTRI
jgi:Fe-Mn family superoxide dismutase